MRPERSSLAAPDRDCASRRPDRMFQLCYERLHAIAAGYFREEKGYRTLQPTAVVHEAYLRLARDPTFEWESRPHFLAFAARVMRQVLIDSARLRRQRKRGAGALRVTLEDEALEAPDGPLLLDLDRALQALTRRDPRKAEVVQMRFYAGMTIEEVAMVLEVSVATVNREWRLARAWIGRELDGTPGETA